MDQTFLSSILLTGFAVAFFHAAIPTHWLPFVLAGRGQGWTRAKTLAVASLAGVGHTLFTTVLGVLVVWLGIETSKWTGDVFPFIVGGVLLLLGLFYLVRQARGGHGHRHWFRGSRHPHNHGQGHHHGSGHAHAHPDQGHVHAHPPVVRPPARKSDGAVILGLMALLTFSPCEAFLPVYLSGVRYGWSGFVLLSLVLALATVAGMVVFTWLTIAGLERLKLEALERIESGVLGGLLCLLGLMVMVFER